MFSFSLRIYFHYRLKYTVFNGSINQWNIFTWSRNVHWALIACNLSWCKALKRKLGKLPYIGVAWTVFGEEMSLFWGPPLYYLIALLPLYSAFPQEACQLPPGDWSWSQSPDCLLSFSFLSLIPVQSHTREYSLSLRICFLSPPQHNSETTFI